MDIESIIAAANRAQQAEDANIGNCDRTWLVGLFFDGIHRNIEQDASENRLSNVARLFRAFPSVQQDTSHESYSKFYISGLGTPFKENLTSKLHAIMDSAQSSVMDDLKDQPKEIAKDAGMELLKGSNWWEVLKDSGKKLISPSEWKSLVGDVAKNAAKKSGIEATPWLRDNPTIADMLVTGVDTRITSTKTTFEEAFKEIKTKTPVPVKLISISLFGYDVGATLARKFIDTLLDDICQRQGDKHTYKGIPVEIIFTGLFDCVRHTPASNNNGVDWFVATAGGPIKGISVLMGDKAVDQESALPDTVKNALHLVAAHENRPWRSVYCLGGSNNKHKEELLPGCAEDVGGGLKPNEQKPSAELCRVALHRMYRAATMAGVPFPDLQTLDQTDTDVAAYFIMQDKVKNKSVAQWTKLYQQAVPFNAVSIGAQNRHLDSYIEWLGRQYYQYRCECMKYEKQRDILVSAGSSVGQLGVSSQAKETSRHYQNELDVLHKNWGWLEDVHDAAIKMKNSMENDPNDKRIYIVPNVYKPALRRARRFLDYAHAAYLGQPQPFPEDNAPSDMYAWFIHNRQATGNDVGISQDFLVIRSLEKPDV
ncbi:phospholipase effector Tle1 domain-containing protein [Franconibacter daqui]|uniref:phospholipase effector Tle1 domain-containing protein n=1 Tax=Franconibacter daqui TaxID=2047724 RepID=UPI0030D21A3B